MTSYFSHDSNARNSEKLIKVRMSLGAEGYGVYFMIIERMREEKDYMSIKDYNVIAFDLRVDASVVKRIVEDFGLFVFTEDGKYFYSESFLRRMEIKDEKSRKKSEAGKKGAAKRWGEKEDRDNNIDCDKTQLPNNNGSAIAELKKNIASKGKESKVKKSKEIKSQKDCDDSKNNKTKYKFDEKSTEIELARFMIKEMLKVKSDSKVPNSDFKYLQAWGQDIDYMIRLDNRSARDIAELFRWAQEDTFWCSNIRSPRKLREKWDSLALQKNEREEKNSGKSNDNSKRNTGISSQLAEDIAERAGVTSL